MAADDLNAPLGQKTKRRLSLPVAVPQAIAGMLGVFILVFVLWAALTDNPFGGEPIAIVSVVPSSTQEAKTQAPAGAAVASAGAESGSRRYDGPEPRPAAARPASGAQTITIIDGSSGNKQEVILPAPAQSRPAPAVDARLLESSRHGPIPRIGPDGTRPSDAYARPLKAGENHSGGARVALIIGSLGIGATSTAGALAKLPAPVTLAFVPYGNDIESFVARARGSGHEVLLQIPMEPLDYPDNDPGPQTLLTSLSPEQNVDRLQWLLSRVQGYVGIGNFMGARLTASEKAISPVLREAAKRGLIYFDDGSSPRSLTDQIAGANKVPFAKADVTIDSVPTAAEIEKALGRLESMARERGFSVGMGSSLPVTIDQVTKWTKAAAARGVILVPISAVAVKAKSS